MASAVVTRGAGDERALADPWRWMWTGVGASAAAFCWARLFGDGATAVRFLLIAAGLAGATTAVCLRFWAGRPLLRHLKEGAAGERTAGAGLLVLAGLTAFLTCWALYLGAERAEEWDSLRLLLAVATLVAFAASIVVASGPRLRRVLLSALIVFHLGGIVTAVLAYPPSPWLMQVLRSRVYGPYLEFMQLSNAYRFYSPEPWPATQLWFRVEYHDADHDRVVWNWFKIPDVDEEGQPRDALRVRYQRRLSLTENITPSLPMPPREYRDRAGLIRTAEYFRKRDRQCPEPTAKENQKDLLGQEKATSKVFVPYLWQVVPAGDPRLGYTEFAAPDINSRLLLRSYARYAARLPHPKYPNATVKSVKLYKVLHRTLTPQETAAGADPQDLTNFLPYYEGQYDPQGNLQDPDDPFLYWMLPIVRVHGNNPNLPIQAWLYLHSGDEEHYRALLGR